MKRIQIASKSKRISSSLIDLTIIGGLFALSYFFIFYKAVSAVQHFDEKNEIIKQERIKTGLYESDGSTTILVKNPNIPTKDLADKIEKFYTVYLREKLTDQSKVDYTKYWYGVSILHLNDKLDLIKDETVYKEENILFKWSSDFSKVEDAKYEVKSGVNETDLRDFYKASFGTAVYNLSLSDLTPIKNAARAISFGAVRALLYSSIFSTIIPCFIVPISIKNGKTVGKLITGLVVLTDEGYEYKRYKHIFRYLSFYIVEFFGGVITIGITFILSTCLVLFSKKHRALHDYISFSCVADEKHSVFYKDEQEENEYKNKDITELTLE